MLCFVCFYCVTRAPRALSWEMLSAAHPSRLASRLPIPPGQSREMPCLNIKDREEGAGTISVGSPSKPQSSRNMTGIAKIAK